MICTTLHHLSYNELLEALERCEMAEIRLDSCNLTLNEIGELFSSDVPLVATCRIGEGMSAPMAEKRLVKAVESGASFVDVELGAPKEMSKRVRQAAHESGVVFIRSHHDFSGTDSTEALKAIVDKCRYYGADMVKLVTTAKDASDAERVLSLYDSYEPYGLVAFCMGGAGRQSRLDCLAKGAPFTYAAFSEEAVAADGQWTAGEMEKAVYGDFPFIDGESDVPCSKSFAQRAIVAAALADGTTRLNAYTKCGDNEAAIDVAKSLGATVSKEGDTLVISGISAGSRANAQYSHLHVGESGLLTRLMIPISAQINSCPVQLTGEKTLLTRQLDGLAGIVENFGATVESASDDKMMVPLTVFGPLKTGRVEVIGKYGSQLISGLLMALPLADKNTTIVVKEPRSIPYMFITLDVLRKFGVKVTNEMSGGRDFIDSDCDWSHCTEMEFRVHGSQHYKAAEFELEGDWSAASNFLVAGAVFGKVRVHGLDTTSVQADIAIMDVLMSAGASLSQEDDEKGDILVQRAPLSAFTVDLTHSPDIFPITAVLAAFCQGESHIGGIERLQHKESDRGQAILEMLERMGVKAGIEGNDMVVEGKSLQQRLLTGELLRGGEYSTHHDHRMAMALRVASLGASENFVIDDEDCVRKSFPDFFEKFDTL